MGNTLITSWVFQSKESNVPQIFSILNHSNAFSNQQQCRHLGFTFDMNVKTLGLVSQHSCSKAPRKGNEKDGSVGIVEILARWFLSTLDSPQHILFI